MEWNHEETMNYFCSLHILTDKELEQMESENLDEGLAFLASDPTVMLNYYKQDFKLSFGSLAKSKHPFLDLQGKILNLRLLTILVQITSEIPREKLQQQKLELKGTVEDYQKMLAGKHFKTMLI